MKLQPLTGLLFVISQCIFFQVYGQAISAAVPDSLAAVPLKYDLVDSNHVKQFFGVKVIGITPIFYDATDIAYRDGKERDRWVMVHVLTQQDFDNQNEINEAVLIGRGGSKGVVVKGKQSFYGEGYGAFIYWMQIIYCGQAPLRVLKVKYGNESSFIALDDSVDNGQGFERTITILKNGVQLSGGFFDKTDSSKQRRDYANMTYLSDGTYRLKNKRMVLDKIK